MTWREELNRYVVWLLGRENKASRSYMNSVKSVGKRMGKRFNPDSFLDLNGEDILTWVGELWAEGLAEASVTAYMAQVRAMAHWLNEEVNDKDEVPKAFRGGNHKTYSRVNARSDLLSDKDLEALVAHLKTPRDATAALLMRYTGARPSEVLGLRRDDVEFITKEGRTFAILAFRETKTGKARGAVLADSATIGTLQRYLEFLKGDLLFPAPRSEGPLSYQTFAVSMSRAAKAADIKTRVYPYLLRHTFATMEGARLPTHIRMRQMGTKSETIFEHYDHVSGEDVIEVLVGMEGTGRPEVVDGGAAGILREFMGLIIDQNMRMVEALGSVLPLEDIKRLLPPEEQDRMMELATKLGHRPDEELAGGE